MKIWKQWRTALVVVQPATVVSWQRRRFKQYWWKLSQKKGPGRPAVSAELRKLVRTMAAANVTWGAPRIHGELLKLGFKLSERTVSRLMPKQRTGPSPTWKTFLSNHVGQLVSIDFFTVPTVQLRVLFVFVLLAQETSSRAAFQCDGASHGSMGGTADHRSIPGRRCTAIFDQGP